ncbi:citrate-binding protein-like [Rutidosis leptorrhynchoides]|uniref:citrate-binding protein-like n=1 Tax=Rutidosis leptorrhynchoides TaxID=125765 RepID=UPI003A99B153
MVARLNSELPSILDMSAACSFLFDTTVQIISTHSQVHDLALDFNRLPFNATFYSIDSPYNLPVHERYSFHKGVHKLWVFSSDKPLYRGSHTFPRCEIAIDGYKYTKGIWQFEGYIFVPQGTTRVGVMQIFGADPPVATTMMLHVYNGDLYYYRHTVVIRNIYNKWIRLNVIHDVEGNDVEVYINGDLKFKGNGRGGTTHYFKCGVYAEGRKSGYMESRWRDIKVFRKFS